MDDFLASLLGENKIYSDTPYIGKDGKRKPATSLYQKLLELQRRRDSFLAPKQNWGDMERGDYKGRPGPSNSMKLQVNAPMPKAPEFRREPSLSEHDSAFQQTLGRGEGDIANRIAPAYAQGDVRFGPEADAISPNVTGDPLERIYQQRQSTTPPIDSQNSLLEHLRRLLGM